MRRAPDAELAEFTGTIMDEDVKVNGAADLPETPESREEDATLDAPEKDLIFFHHNDHGNAICFRLQILRMEDRGNQALAGELLVPGS